MLVHKHLVTMSNGEVFSQGAILIGMLSHGGRMFFVDIYGRKNDGVFKARVLQH